MKLALPDIQTENFTGKLFDPNLAYWRTKLKGINALQLPLNSVSSIINTEGTFTFPIDKSVSDKLKILSEDQDVSFFTTLLAAFKIMLHRYTSQQNICIGTVFAKKVIMEGISGHSSNALALCTHLDGEVSFPDFLQQIKITIAEALKHQPISIEEVMAVASSEDGTSINPDQIMYVLLEPADTRTSASIIIKGTLKHIKTSFKLTFTLNELTERLQATVTFRKDLYSTKTIERMMEYYVNLLNSIVQAPSLKIGSMSMISKTDEAILEKFNSTLTDYPKDKTLVDLFEEQVLKTPGNIALIKDELSITYKELNEQANILARRLLRQGVVSGSNVGLIVNRDFNMIIGMYAILKAGAAYIPIDPEYPAERQKYILTQSSASHLLSDADYPVNDLLSDLGVINLNDREPGVADNTNLNIAINSRQLAYTIYTSGSTGVPKGVMIEHHSAVNLILWVNNRFKINQHDRVLFITSMCFDLSVYDIFGLLSAGGSVVIANQEEVIDVMKLKELLQDHKITFWDSVPTTMNYLIRELKSGKEPFVQESLRLVFMSGDWIPVQLPGEIKQFFPNAQVISLGGATEGTVWSNYYPVDKVDPSWTSIPYGKPIANNFFYVLNEQLNPVPVGVTGELFIGGVGVARGYANDKTKSYNSFIPDPFNKEAGGRMYRTGDLGRMLPDGNLEFLGRTDTQIKIRGYRVEMGEIENVLNKSSLINQAVVIARGDKEGDKTLIAFIVPNSDDFDRKEILAYLKSKLPDYMIPSALEVLKQFPLTANGKIDKKALALKEVKDHKTIGYTAPQNESQNKLAVIWQEILGVEKVGIHDNFFELGGHSLMAVRMITKFETETGLKLPLSILFKYPTISSLLGSLEIDKEDLDTSWKSLVPIKASGSKMPVYIIHGSGLNVMNFNDITKHVDPEQPVFGLQAKGLNGTEEPLDDMKLIAQSYIREIMEHNPSGPYAIAGYSFGGYVAVEMRNQLELLGKRVQMLAIFDTNAVESPLYQTWQSHLTKKIKRQVPKFFWILKSLYNRPKTTINYQLYLLLANVKSITKKISGADKADFNEFYKQLDKINEKHWHAFNNYNLTPFNDRIYLFRARERIYYVNDFKHLGWKKYAKKGVRVYDVPGDHKTMLLPPNARQFAIALQHALDNSKDNR